MKNVAQLFFQGGGLILPAQTPYEREFLVEHLESSTRRHGSVRLVFNREQWTVTVDSECTQACDTCSRKPSDLTYRSESSTLCGPCGREALQ